MKLTLRQARRVEREIGTELDIDQTAHGRHGVAVSAYENLLDRLNEIQKDSFEVLAKHQNLLRIRYALRKAVETANEASGLNTLMNREAELKALSKLLTALMTPELTDANITVIAARHAALKASIDAGKAPENHYGQATDTITLNQVCKTETLAKLGEQAKIVQRELLKIVEKQSSLNNSFEVEISDEDVKILEMNNIIV